MNDFRSTPDEQARIASLLRLMPPGGSALEIGSRDGYITRRMAERHDRVVALDLTKPGIALANVDCVAGDVRSLQWPDDRFDVVLCSEVLEHISPEHLEAACAELRRVCRAVLVIGVPFEQDIRVGRTRCARCSTINPPWGHVNRFDRKRLERLFAPMIPAHSEQIGATRHGTNVFSDLLMRSAGYPWGTYSQDEPCIACGERVGPAPALTPKARALAGVAHRIDRMINRRHAPRAKWIHLRFENPAVGNGRFARPSA